MQYRTQTYLGALQFLAIIAGLLVLGAMVKSADTLDLLDPPIGLRYARIFAHWGGVLLVVPALWIKLTIQAEQSDLRWATKRFTFVSGLALLGVLAFLFAFATLITTVASYIKTVGPMGPAD
jgi:hypothetical protein